VKGPSLPFDFIYASYKDGLLGLKKVEDEYWTYKIRHVAHLLKSEQKRRIITGYRKLMKSQHLPVFQMLIPNLEKALDKLNVE
jgi:hypothetical protein